MELVQPPQFALVFGVIILEYMPIILEIAGKLLYGA
jgi:hypothetical protein